MLKVFLAGPYPLKAKLKANAASLSVRGIEIVSDWLYEPDGQTFYTIDSSQARLYAARDLENINNCDLFVYFAGDGGGGGKDFEMGYAHYVAKEIILVGQPRNIYHYLPDVIRYDNWAQAHKHIVELADCKLEWLDNQE